MQAALVKPTLASGHAAAMIAVVKNNSVFVETIFFELRENRANLLVHLGEAIVVLSPILAYLRCIGMIRRHCDLGWVVNGLVRSRAKLAFVTYCKIKHSEKWLTGLALAPMRLVARLVPKSVGFADVVVFLGVIGAVVTKFMEVLGIELGKAREANAATHMLSPETIGKHAGDNSRPRGSTDWCIRPAVCVSQSLGREGIDVWCRRIFISIATKFRSIIFGSDPKDIGTDLSRIKELRILSHSLGDEHRSAEGEKAG